MINVKKKISDKEVSLGTWQMIGNTAITEIMCQCAFDWITIDLEHTGIAIDNALELIRVVDLAGKAPAVRVSSNDYTLIKRVLDSGAKIIIVPMVMNGKDAKKAVDAVYYPPKGTRGVGLSRAQAYGFGFEKYQEEFNKQAMVVAQIEHVDAIDNLEEILNVEGIDATMIGPYDLSGSLGHPGDFDREDFKQALQKYETLSRKMNKPMGYHIVEPNRADVEKQIKKGYNFMALGFDSYFLGKKCREVLDDVRF